MRSPLPVYYYTYRLQLEVNFARSGGKPPHDLSTALERAGSWGSFLEGFRKGPACELFVNDEQRLVTCRIKGIGGWQDFATEKPRKTPRIQITALERLIAEMIPKCFEKGQISPAIGGLPILVALLAGKRGHTARIEAAQGKLIIGTG